MITFTEGESRGKENEPSRNRGRGEREEREERGEIGESYYAVVMNEVIGVAYRFLF